MNKTFKKLSLAVTTVVFAACAAQAQAEPGHGPSQFMDEHLKHELNLTLEQQIQLIEAEKDFEVSLLSLKDHFEKKVDSILTEEQKVKREQLKEQAKEKMKAEKGMRGDRVVVPDKGCDNPPKQLEKQAPVDKEREVIIKDPPVKKRDLLTIDDK